MPFTTVVSVSSCQLSALEGCSEDELSVESQIQATCFNFDWHFILSVQFFLSALWFLQIGSNIEGKWDINTQLNLLLLWNYSVLSRAWHFWLLRKITVFAGKRLEILNVETAGSGDQDAWEKSPGRAARRGQQRGAAPAPWARVVRCILGASSMDINSALKCQTEQPGFPSRSSLFRKWHAAPQKSSSV